MATRAFGEALDYIADHHNRTAASPPVAVAIGEFGVAEVTAPAGTVEAVAANVVAFALSPGQGATNKGRPRAAYAMYWELFNNEVIGEAYTRCNAATGPMFNESHNAGFWIFRPDGSRAFMHGYMSGLINGTIPPPTPPPAPSGTCTYLPDTDIDDTPGSEVPGVASQEDCCAACARSATCGASVFVPEAGQCWLKDPGGTQWHSPGRVACVPQ